MNRFKLGDRVRLVQSYVELYRCVSTDGNIVRLEQPVFGEYRLVGVRFSDGVYRVIEAGNLELIVREGDSIKTKRKGFMSLLKRLLDPDMALIEKHAMRGDNLDMDSSIVQQALLSVPEFKQALIKLCKKEEANKEKNV